MAGLTRAELLSRTRNRLKALADDATLSDTILRECVNDGLASLAEEHDWPWLEATTTIAVTAGTDSYALPADLTRIHVVSLDGVELDAIEYRDLLRYSASPASTPRRYATINGTIVLSPTPIDSVTLDLLYQREEKYLTDDTATTYAPRRVASLMASYCAVYGAVRLQDQTLIATLDKLRETELNRTVDTIQRTSVGPRIVTRNDNYA